MVTSGAGGQANAADDTAALYQFVRRRAQAQSAAIETFDVQTPYLALGFEVGNDKKQWENMAAEQDGESFGAGAVGVFGVADCG
jgi:hypothetical protein